LNTELFIAKHIIGAKNKINEGDSSSSDGKIRPKLIGTKPIIRIATFSVALGIAVMIISIAIVTGFKSQIRDKVIGFGSHIQITNFDANSSFEPQPIDRNQPFYPSLDTVSGIRHIQIYATKAGIIKTENDMQGVVIKGISTDFDWDFFNSKIIDGASFEIHQDKKSNKIIISKYIASKLKLNVGDDLLTYFIQKPPRMRKFTITGIYETGLEEFDRLYVLADIKHIQKLNDWDSSQVGGFEILIDNFDDLDELGDYVYYKVIGAELFSQTVKEANSQIFDWLELQNMNAIIILVLMVVVAAINMISALLVLILERTNMIGILKALGAQNWSIRKIFLYISSWLIGKAMLWGNIIGLSFCFLQLHFELLTLDQDSYYVSVVPISINWFNILLLNAGTLLICAVALILPSMVVSKILPVKAIKFN